MVDWVGCTVEDEEGLFGVYYCSQQGFGDR
jgi:hypothetical protein